MNKPQRYPLIMKHPEYAPAVIEMEAGPDKGLFKAGGRQVSPARYPDVTVKNVDDEKRHAALGYRPAGGYDAAEYEKTILDCANSGLNKSTEYPKWKYHDMEMPCIVQNRNEESALGSGWRDTPAPAEDAEERIPCGDYPEPAEQKIDKRSKAYRDAQKTQAA